MRRNNRGLYLFIVACCYIWAMAVPAYAQDSVPVSSLPDRHSGPSYPSKEIRDLMRFIPLEDSPMPAVFQQTAENVLTDPVGVLHPFFHKLSAIDRPLRIVHIGDSHVRGHVFPYEMRQCLETDFGNKAVESLPVTYQSSGLARETGQNGIVYHIMGVNGATCSTFSTPDRLDEIAALQPDLIVVSFGTNEAHGRNYVRSEHYASMNLLVKTLKERCPEVAFLFTTPPGAYRRVNRRARTINTNTPKVVDTELDFARENGIAVWDMYHIVGGAQRACLNWSAANLFQRDKIHFTREGYKLQGLLFHEAFIKAYNEYVANRLE